MVEFRPFLAGDLVQLALQPSQRLELGVDQPLSMEYGRDLAANGPSWTAYQRGRILCCAGFRETFAPVQAVAWAMLAEGIGGAHLAITRFARLQIAEAPYRRLEAIVEAKNGRAVAWAQMVGLQINTMLECFGANSEPHILFERVKL
jgi:hypothetical protein